jgi:hypothetical protein
MVDAIWTQRSVAGCSDHAIRWDGDVPQIEPGPPDEGLRHLLQAGLTTYVRTGPAGSRLVAGNLPGDVPGDAD